MLQTGGDRKDGTSVSKDSVWVYGKILYILAFTLDKNYHILVLFTLIETENCGTCTICSNCFVGCVHQKINFWTIGSICLESW